jgi:glutamyl-tRNA reductase
MNVSVFGINYQTAELGQLETISLSKDEVMKTLVRLQQADDIAELAIVSTCNRLEFYIVAEAVEAAQARVIELMQTIRPQCPESVFEQWYLKTGPEAHTHLFRVACGLDSLVIGENEIVGQVKEAYRRACRQETAGSLLHKLFHAAFKTSKRVKNETEINQGCCSVGAAAVDAAERFCKDLCASTVLLIGAGEIAHVTARILAKRRAGRIWIANRSGKRAECLAHEVGGAAIPFHTLYKVIAQADVIISSTSAPGYLVTFEDMQQFWSGCGRDRLLILDIALPRDFDPHIAELSGVELQNIYDLKAIVDRNLQQREQELATAEQIVAEEVRKFLEQQQALRIQPIIQTAKASFEDIRRAELRKYRYQFQDEAFARVEKLTRTLTNKYLHGLISQLKRLNEADCLEAGHLRILEEVFAQPGNRNGST